ncbi:glycosyltransferase family A protein, partial [Neobacillus mesonae]|uniref:glycosyltransferase family A protein n=1 Tax=Neobacillus mesonae TaxID=1193713 RepID=UPI002E1D94C1|nr:glycosyltransferase family A protein [Neobacillus mesonae]
MIINSIQKRRTPIFSIIISAYNVENYLTECLNSLISQTIGFSENVEVIIVDDHSTDKTLVIAESFVSKYPNNIKVFKNIKEGVSSARNEGINIATGKYFNFLDADDYLEKNCLENIYNFFEERQKEIDLVSIPMIRFGSQSGQHMLNDKFKADWIINTEQTPDYIQLSSSSSFIKSELFKDKRYR